MEQRQVNGIVVRLSITHSMIFDPMIEANLDYHNLQVFPPDISTHCNMTMVKLARMAHTAF